MIILEADNLQEIHAFKHEFCVYYFFFSGKSFSFPACYFNLSSCTAITLCHYSQKQGRTIFLCFLVLSTTYQNSDNVLGRHEQLSASLATHLHAVALAGAHVNSMGWVTHRKSVELKVIKVLNQCISLGCSVLRTWFGDVTEPTLTDCRLYWKLWSCFPCTPCVPSASLVLALVLSYPMVS